MSVMFGRWNFEGERPEMDYVERISSILAPYASDGVRAYSSEDVSLLYFAFHTTRESQREIQPLTTRSGAVITWDGRIDNREELIGQLEEPISPDCGDVSIVSRAYERWGTKCFAKLLGDWALCVWNPNDRSVTLAKDPIGLRQLYYSIEKNQFTWSTVLDPLVLFARKALLLNQEYIAGLFSFFPAAHLTPYVDIQSVPPSSFVRIETKRLTITKYWDFDPAKTIRYRNDGEYEEHFRTVFAESVKRRLRSDTPVLAELSGGMDSTSIVCVADSVSAGGSAVSPRIDTISYYDDSEPNWNERPYFAKVEERRGRVGYHINAYQQTSLVPEYQEGRFAATLWSGLKPNEFHAQFARCIRSNANRVVLSGLGGDEVLGGVPAPTPELADLLTTGQLSKFGKQLVSWALQMRKPAVCLVADILRRFLPPGMIPVHQHKRAPVWLDPSFVRRYRVALAGYQNRLNLFGPLPTFQENLNALDGLRRQLGCSVQPCDPPYERRYPYLDRDLLEFIYAIPREQLLRPNQRRSLMRRALIGIVPDEVLNRKRKAFVARSPLIAISSEWVRLNQMTQGMVSSSLRIVDPQLFVESLQNARHAQEIQILPLMRTIAIEAWLKNLAQCGIASVVRSTSIGDETDCIKANLGCS
jgi:asparagine synthase (glutamine-hydrolysing)